MNAHPSNYTKNFNRNARTLQKLRENIHLMICTLAAVPMELASFNSLILLHPLDYLRTVCFLDQASLLVNFCIDRVVAV